MLMFPRFVQSIKGSTRERLQATREMLMLCFTYFRVMPEFIGFLFSFGHQSHAQNPYFSSFRQSTNLFDSNQPLIIPELNWSGGELQVCYNLMSAERSGSGPSDWSVRPFAVHHTLDMINIRANWIIIKGNDNMKDFFEKATTGQGHTNFSSFDTLDRSFAASLAAHLVFCGWAAERWRWYINNLEDQFQNFSRKTLTAPVIAASKPGFPFIKDDFQTQHRNDNSKTSGAIAARLTRTQKWIAKKFPISIPKPVSPVQLTYTDPDSGLSQPLPPHITLNSAPGPAAQPSRPIFENMEEQDFSFAKLQKIQYIEEKAHEALLTIRLNVNVITQLQQYYSTVPKTKHFPQSILRTFKDDLNQFRLRINTILNDLQIQTLRLETLLRLLDNRKTLVYPTYVSISQIPKLNFVMSSSTASSNIETQR